MVYDIKGKIALITGGAAGIGYAYSEELFRNGLGGVVIADVNAENGDQAVNTLNKEFGANKAVFIKTDVTKVDQLEAAFKLAISTFGTLDIIINNAGIMNDAHWELEIAINCNAVVQGSLLGIKYIGKNNGGKGGVIVNIASILGLQELAGCPIYVGTKHFVVGLDRSFGTPYYYNLTGIKFVTMCPGVTDTPLISEAGKFAIQGLPDLGKVLAEELGSLPAQPSHSPPPLLRRDYCEETKPAKCKVAIVTGGARGIGYHVSESLLKAGARAVVLGDVLVDELEEATCKLNEKYGENKALFQPCDVTKREEMEKIFKCTKEKFGKIDIVVNNAGIAESEWEKMIDINVKGVVLGTLLGFQHMGAHCGGKGGHIINVASILGLQPLFSMPVYSGTKWFVVGFTKSMGSDYFNDKTKVKVMAVCPGVTDTEIISNAGKATLPTFDELDKEAAKSLGSLAPQGRKKTIFETLKDKIVDSIFVSESGEFCKIPMPEKSLNMAPPLQYGDGKNVISISASDKHKDSKKDKCKDDKSKSKDHCKKKDPCKKDKCKDDSKKSKH